MTEFETGRGTSRIEVKALDDSDLDILSLGASQYAYAELVPVAHQARAWASND